VLLARSNHSNHRLNAVLMDVIRPIRILENRSELGAGTRGASLGIDALKIACLNQGSDYFYDHRSTRIPDLNYLLFEEEDNLLPLARYADGILSVLKNVANAVSNTLKDGQFPLVLAGDHSSAAGTIAGIKEVYPDATLGVVWIDAHADIHSPYTTPSGNVHGMPLAIALHDDNLPCRVNDPDPETLFFWERMQRVGTPDPKLRPEHLVYVALRDYEEPELAAIARNQSRVYWMSEIDDRGVGTIAAEIREHLGACDLLYISFDVDSLDPEFSRGTGTPVEHGMSLGQASGLLRHLLVDPRIACFEMVEINPTLDEANTMATNAFRLLDQATRTLEARQPVVQEEA
jgi:arginase